MSIDDLAHDAETEAEVLRAVAHMTPSRAQEFLVALVLKIRRANRPTTGITLPRLLASVITETPAAPMSAPALTPTGQLFRGTTGQIVAFIRLRGAVTSAEAAAHCGATTAIARNGISALMSALKRRGVLRLEDGAWSLTQLDVPEETASPTESTGT